MAADDTMLRTLPSGVMMTSILTLPANAHALGELGIGWRGLALNFALAFIRVRLLCDHKSGSKQSGCLPRRHRFESNAISLTLLLTSELERPRQKKGTSDASVNERRRGKRKFSASNRKRST